MQEATRVSRRTGVGTDTQRDGAGLLLAGQNWAWRWAGIAVAGVFAMIIAVTTLSPMPAPQTVTTGIDKVYHFIAFGALIFPLILTDSRRWFWAVPLVAAYGGAIELIQPTIGRNAEWLDFGANISGILAGAALAEILHDRIRARFFALDAPSRAAEAEAEEEAGDDRLEAMRAELMQELRAALREELRQAHSAEGASAFAPVDASEGARLSPDAVPETAAEAPAVLVTPEPVAERVLRRVADPAPVSVAAVDPEEDGVEPCFELPEAADLGEPVPARPARARSGSRPRPHIVASA